MKNHSRLVELDGLRGLAALSVVLFHYTFRYDELFGQRAGLAIRVPAGELGVMLFFMISGFVILMTLERTTRPLDFVYRRFSRLYPTYWAAVAATFAVVSFCGLPGQEVSPGEALFNLTMVQRFFGANHVDGAYWSLQAELFFYAAMLLLWQFVGLKRVPPVLLGWMGMGVAMHFAVPWLEGAGLMPGRWLDRVSTLANLPYIHLFAVGIALYELRQHRSQGTSLMVLVSAVVMHTLVHGWVQGLMIAGLVGLLAAGVTGALPVLASPPLAWLGAVSYALYLIHQNIGYCVIRSLDAVGTNPNFSVAVAIVLSLALAALLTKWVEQPALAWFRQLPRAGGCLRPVVSGS